MRVRVRVPMGFHALFWDPPTQIMYTYIVYGGHFCVPDT